MNANREGIIEAEDVVSRPHRSLEVQDQQVNWENQNTDATVRMLGIGTGLALERSLSSVGSQRFPRIGEWKKAGVRTGATEPVVRAGWAVGYGSESGMSAESQSLEGESLEDEDKFDAGNRVSRSSFGSGGSPSGSGVWIGEGRGWHSNPDNLDVEERGPDRELGRGRVRGQVGDATIKGGGKKEMKSPGNAGDVMDFEF